MADSKKPDPKKPFHEVVAERLIEQLKAGTAPWQRPWDAGAAGSYLPMNPTTGKRYKGINAIHLMAQGHEDSRWMTYKQAAAVGAQVRKGEKGTPVQYWKFSEEQDKLDDAGRPVKDANGDPVKVNVMLERPRVFFATVFNAEQIDGLPPMQRKEQTWDAIERAEQIIAASGAVIHHDGGGRAFYRPSTDDIHMPDRGAFPSAANYYGVKLHELGHWTGHESRLDRDLAHPFGSEEYAKEELRAEIASMIIGDELGIGHDPEQHAAYVGSWIKALENDPLEIFRASAEAEKIHDYVLAFEQKQVQEQTQEAAQNLTKVHAVSDPLAVDIAEVLTAPGVTFNHFQDFQGASLDHALRSRGLSTVESITGRDPARFYDEAHARLSPVFGITPEHSATDNPYLERKGLAQAFAAKAETLIQAPQQQQQEAPKMQQSRRFDPFSDDNFAAQVGVTKTPPTAAEGWVLSHVERGTLTTALETASLDQVDRVLGVLDSMQPLNTQNAFWGRHELPADVDALNAKVERAFDDTMNQRSDAIVAATLRDLRAGNANSREHNLAAFETAVDNAFEFSRSLPHDWTGEVRIVGVVERDGQTVAADLANETPAAYQLHARKGDAVFGEDAFVFLTATRTLEQANTITDRLAIIDANALTDEALRAAKLARVQEDRVRRDPDSTSEEISAAKEMRLTADAAVFGSHAGELHLVDGWEWWDEKLMLLQESAQDAQELAAGKAALGERPAEGSMIFVDKFGKRVAGREDAARREEMPAKQLPAAEQAKTYINVPFREKNEAKQLGARWDRQQQSWYVPGGVDPAPFAKWSQAVQQAPDAQGQQAPADRQPAERQYLAVPYGERGAAKAAGALWDKAAKSWYAGPNSDMERLARWKPDNMPEQGPAMTPKEEFAEALADMGCLVSGDHPIMDGQRHRIAVEGDKKGEQAGFYVGHLDGHPAGYIKNNRTGLDMKWKSKGYALDPEEKAKLQAEAATKLAARAAEQDRQHEATAQRVERQAEGLLPITEPTTYMQTKGIQPHAGALTDKDGKKTFIPAYDVDGKQWTMQYIQEDGTKRFAKDSRKEGCFHPLGGMDALAAAPALVIAEGYATAGTIADELGHATVAAFDSGNLPAVAKALHEKFPDKPVIIAGDDDRHQIITQGTNPGRTKAEEAAKAVGGTAIFPIFAPGENVYPAELPPITPQAYREHERATQRLDAAAKDPDAVKLSDQEAADLKKALLSPEQLAGIAGMKAHTDFNDLATRSELGREGVARQVGAAVSQAIDAKAQHQEREQKQEQAQHQHQHQEQEQKPRRAMRV